MKKLLLMMTGVLVLLVLSGNAHAVKCMRKIPPSNPDKVYTDHGDGTVTDTRTGLMWKRCSEGQTFTNGTCTGDATTHAWDTAKSLARKSAYAGHNDWRLPGIQELRGLVETCRNNPAINDTVFPMTPSELSWSENIYDRRPNSALFVNFADGDIGNYAFKNGLHVRLVRGKR